MIWKWLNGWGTYHTSKIPVRKKETHSIKMLWRVCWNSNPASLKWFFLTRKPSLKSSFSLLSCKEMGYLAKLYCLRKDLFGNRTQPYPSKFHIKPHKKIIALKSKTFAVSSFCTFSFAVFTKTKNWCALKMKKYKKENPHKFMRVVFQDGIEPPSISLANRAWNINKKIMQYE